MLWKVYFFVYLAIMVIGGGPVHPTPLQSLFFVLTVPTTVIGLFAYAFGWPRLPRTAWRVFLSAAVVGLTASFILLIPRLPVFTGRFGPLAYILGTGVILCPVAPSLYALTKSALGKGPAVIV
jgi:hypothetical protein